MKVLPGINICFKLMEGAGGDAFFIFFILVHPDTLSTIYSWKSIFVYNYGIKEGHDSYMNIKYQGHPWKDNHGNSLVNQ